MTFPSNPGDEKLQFDTAVTNSVIGDAGVPSGAVCTQCQRAICSEYFEVNGSLVCAACRDAIVAHVETPRGWRTFLLAGLFGGGAAVAGAALYYAVIAITDFEIGIVAIAIGYMVGYAIRRATHARGGRRFQVLAMALTYAAVALAYAPLVLSAEFEDEKSAATAAAARATPSADAEVVVSTKARGSENVRADNENAEAQSTTGVVRALVLLIGFIAALPVLSVVSSFPGGLISAAIIAFGMQQAWRMTGQPAVTVHGPYRIGRVASAALP